ncbi:MAG: ATP-binding cassette domain-containing protein [Candidatus Altiarchaeota archaeon]|nr:ATP-binding cassette domain-containing protein [Candidatus Altiarchaeota archaeon]
MTSCVEIRNYSFSFLDSESRVLDHVNLEIGSGEFISILGANGSGKTTLALSMAGIIPHLLQGRFVGGVFVNDKNTLEHDIHDIVSDVGFLLQDYESQFFFSTVEEEIRFHLDNHGLLSEERIKKLSSELGIHHLLKRKFLDLSEGEKQKALLASILSTDPGILVLDEPTSQLDALEREGLLQTLKQLNGAGKTIILITHDSRAARYSSRYVVLSGGCVVEDSKDPLFLQNETLSSYGVEPLNLNWGGSEARKAAVEKRLSVEGLCFREILDGVNLEIRAGEFILLMGGNGSGKTTLLKHLNRLRDPDGGQVLLEDKPLMNHSRRDIARNVGFLFQNPEHQLFRNTVAEEVEYTLDVLGAGEGRKRVREILDLFDLGGFSDRSPQSLSTGEKQRLALASSLVSNPRIMVLDEPMTYLDFNGKKRLMSYLSEMKKQGMAIVVVSHQPGYYGSLADRTMLLDNGRLIEQ